MELQKPILILILILCFAVSSSVVLVDAEPSWVEWSQTYGGIEDDGALHLVYIIETFDGGYALCGYTTSFGGDDADFWLVKTDASGNMEWNKIFGGEKTDISESMVQTSDWGYVLIGTTESFGAGNHDGWLVKTDSNGNMQWNRTHGGENSDWGHSLIVTSDGGFAFVGESDSFGAGGYDFWLVKTDELGFIEWSRTYGGPERDSAESLVMTSDGGYVLSGFAFSFGHVGSDIYLESDIWLVKTNEKGIPEFPSWIILPSFVVATVVVTIVRYKLKCASKKRHSSVTFSHKIRKGFLGRFFIREF